MNTRKNDRHALRANRMANACGDKATHQKGTDCLTVQQLRRTHTNNWLHSCLLSMTRIIS